VTVFLVFLAPPLVLAAFWWRSMPAHSWGMTLAAGGGSLLVSLFVMVESGRALWQLRRATGAGEAATAPRRPWAKALLWGFCAMALTSFGFVRTVEPVESFHQAYLYWRDAVQISEAIAKRYEAERLGDRGAVRKAKAELKEIKERHRDAIDAAGWDRFPFDLAPARLSGVVLVEKPMDWRDFQTARTVYRVSWCKNEGLPPEVCGPVPTANADPPAFLDNQRSLWCERMFSDKPERTTGCQPYFDSLNRRFLVDWESERRAELAALPRRDLKGADLRGAALFGAQMEGADLRRAQMEGADLRGAQLEGANLAFARMEGANLMEAQMEGTELFEAQLEGANLGFAQMEGANLSFAHIEGANLLSANLKSAVLYTFTMTRTSLRSADLSEAERLEQTNVNAAWGDIGTILPDGIMRPDHWDTGTLEYPWDPDPKYDAWIAAGAPPGKPVQP
jgi:uncharacterized protein YjbI with pentapeptide repeats